MTKFTDPIAAIEEASYLAEDEGLAYAVVDAGRGALSVVPETVAERDRMKVIEVCLP